MIPIQDTVRGPNPPLAVSTLVGLNVLVFALELRLPREELERLFYLFKAMVQLQEAVQALLGSKTDRERAAELARAPTGGPGRMMIRSPSRRRSDWDCPSVRRCPTRSWN